ncbi:MAG TPA: hypothetical protein ENI23_17370 [bacterium]|nr:hypothetical protein [bacterium]
MKFKIHNVFYVAGRGTILVGDVVEGNPEDILVGMQISTGGQEKLMITGIESRLGLNNMSKNLGLIVKGQGNDKYNSATRLAFHLQQELWDIS